MVAAPARSRASTCPPAPTSGRGTEVGSVSLAPLPERHGHLLAVPSFPARPRGRPPLHLRLTTVRRMGFIKDAKAGNLRAEAERAAKEGRTVFAPMLNTPATQSALSGSVAGWAEMIQAVESVGWRMTMWAVASDQKGRPQAYPLFRID